MIRILDRALCFNKSISYPIVHFPLQTAVARNMFGEQVSTRIPLLKLVNNSSSLNKGNHDCDGVWISDMNEHRFLRFYFSVFSLVLVLIEKIYQTLKTVFDHIFKHLDVRQKYSAVSRVCKSLLGVLGEMWSSTVFRVWCITSRIVTMKGVNRDCLAGF